MNSYTKTFFSTFYFVIIPIMNIFLFDKKKYFFPNNVYYYKALLKVKKNDWFLIGKGFFFICVFFIYTQRNTKLFC